MTNPEQVNATEYYEKLTDENEILASFSEEEKREIEQKRQVLSSLAFFIGKDFQIPVELNDPGQGWHWDFKENKIRIDPKDLLEKPMDYLRFVISHEGGHRRISRTEFIPLEIWQQPGFSFMMNAIEDPRDNNFVAENYPKFKEKMPLGYEWLKELETRIDKQAKEKLGYLPRFKQAGFEYIKQWFREHQGEDLQISEDLPDEVREVVRNTIASAQDSWWRYPSRAEADQSEELISRYAERSYEINRDQIWPEFQKLVEKDLEDEKMQELLKDMEQTKGEGQGLPQEMKDKLSPEEQKALEEAIEKALEEAKKGQPEGQEGQPMPIDLDSLSEELKQKIKDYIDSLPEDKKQELAEKAQKAISELEKDINREIEGKLSENPEEIAQKEEKTELPEPTKEELSDLTEGETESVKKYREKLEKELAKDANIYEEKRREVLPIIDKLENELRAIFRARKERRWETGRKSGPSINIQHRIGEIAQGIPAIDSRAWQKREKPSEKDYAISLLIDLSGSMRQGNKIEETFKATIVLTEVLNRLSIKTEILGFNDRLYQYQGFGEPMANPIRENMGGMLKEVTKSPAAYNDDGWAVLQSVERLNAQREKEKFLIVLSDGIPEESDKHPASQYELASVVKKVLSSSKVKLIGLGLGSGTEHVKGYYPNSLVVDNIEEMAEKLSAVIKEAIEHYEKF